MATATNAGTRVISGASSDRKMNKSRIRMKITDRPSTWFLLARGGRWGS
jgi:hypothetical protein